MRWLVVLLNYLSMLFFVKTVKAIPCSFNGMTGCYLYRLAKHLQPNQKLCLLNDSRSNKYQSGEVFEAAFSFKWTKTTSRKYNLLLGWGFSIS